MKSRINVKAFKQILFFSHGISQREAIRRYRESGNKGGNDKLSELYRELTGKEKDKVKSNASLKRKNIKKRIIDYVPKDRIKRYPIYNFGTNQIEPAKYSFENDLRNLSRVKHTLFKYYFILHFRYPDNDGNEFTNLFGFMELEEIKIIRMKIYRSGNRGLENAQYTLYKSTKEQRKPPVIK